MWPFNEEIVARAIYDSEIPIISAVGHETDFTIADFVADLRAPTPSAAAELAVQDIQEVKDRLENYKRKYRILLSKKIELMKLRYEKCISRKAYTNPLQMIQDKYIVLDNLIKSMETSIIKKEKDLKIKTVELITKIDALSPLKILTRGYAVTECNGLIIKSVKNLNINDKIDVRFSDGSVKATVQEINNGL